MGKLTTHVLDTMRGKPAANLEIRLLSANRELLKTVRTNNDGRADAPLLEGESLKAGMYTLEFEVGAYFGSADFSGGCASAIFNLRCERALSCAVAGFALWLQHVQG